MIRVKPDEIPAENLDPSVISAALNRFGWQLAGGKAGVYSRWKLEGSSNLRVILPLDSDRSDYNSLLSEAIQVLAMSEEDSAGRVLRYLVGTPGDELKFRKETSSVRGAISWTAGEELIQSARETIIASAKATADRRSYFGNSNYFLAKEFLNSVLMGQTEIGSYVLTAYTPPQQRFFERKSQKTAPGAIPGDGAHSGRDVVEVMTEALKATRSAIDYYQKTSSMDEFFENVQVGVSRELTQAIKKLVNQSDGASVIVEVNENDELGLEYAVPRKRITEVEFRPTDFSVLERASANLGKPQEIDSVTVVGTVDLLTRRVGTVGVIGLQVIEGSRARRVRVRLPNDSYDIALEAHRNNDAIRVTGRQEREGNFYWLYEPSRVSIVPISSDQMHFGEY